MKKILVFEKRKKARELRSKGWSIRKIAQALIASKNSVNKWIKMTEEEIVSDGRGWERGKLKEHTEIEKKRIIDIRRQLEKECSYFIGELIVKKNYENLYGEPIERWFIKKVLKDSDLVKKKSIKKRDGRSKYMKYPDYTINKLGKIFMSMDFIGPKYLKGGEKRINFLSCKYIRPNKLGIMERTDGQTTEEVIRILSKLWINNPIPDVLKVDNDSAFGTNTLHKNALGRLTIFLLNIGVSPLYVAPRSPWNNGEVEGFNSVFSKKFWDKIRFEDEKEIDVKIKDFNLEYEKYSNLIVNNPEIKEPRYIEKYKNTDFTNKRVPDFLQTKVYFLRIVRREGEKGDEEEKGFIEILGNKINVGKDLINQFTFSILDTKKEELSINIESESKELVEVKRKAIKIENIIKN